jgi:hypothetical protein
MDGVFEDATPLHWEDCYALHHPCFLCLRIMILDITIDLEFSPEHGLKLVIRFRSSHTYQIALRQLS